MVKPGDIVEVREGARWYPVHVVSVGKSDGAGAFWVAGTSRRLLVREQDVSWRLYAGHPDDEDTGPRIENPCRVCGQELSDRALDLGRDICKPCWEDEADYIADQKLSEWKDEGRGR